MAAAGGDLLLRPATEEDLPGLVALDREVRGGADQPAHAADWLDPNAETFLRGWIAAGECVLATVGGASAGYGVLHHQFFHSGMIDLVIVGRPFRRHGVGRAIVRFLAARCRSEKLWISTNLSNTPMQALLAAEGFTMCGFVEGLDEGDPELIYSKPNAHYRR